MPELTTPYICIVILQTIFLFIGTTEIMFILFIVVMVFGADKLPDIAKGMGKGMRQLRDATNDIKGEITKNVNEKDINENLTKDISNEINRVKDELEDITGSVRRKQ